MPKRDWRNPPPINMPELKNFARGVFAVACVFLFLAFSMWALKEMILICREPW